MQILVTNDDGIESVGLWRLALALHRSGLGEVRIVAPSEERSGVGMSFPSQAESEIFAVEPLDHEYADISAWAVTGTPVGCVTAAVLGAAGPRPDLVVSGINRGLNTGSNVMISGTVGAAMVGAFWGIPGLAVSQAVARDEPIFWDVAAEAALRLLPLLLSLEHPAGGAAPVLNLNVPRGGSPRGILQTTLSDFFYGSIIGLGDLVPGSRGHILRYTFDRSRLPRDLSVETDDGAIAAGYISVTPLTPMSVHPHIDLRPALASLAFGSLA